MTTFVLDPATDLVASVPRTSMVNTRRPYVDWKFQGGEQLWNKMMETSSTVYVGNLSCYTNEYQLYELFTRCGSIKRIIMGLDRIKKTPCGFCFIEFDDRASALKSVRYLQKTHLDGRDITVNMDAGFQTNRQFGRGDSGGQRADDYANRPNRRGAYRGGANLGSGGMLTRTITFISLMTLISLLAIALKPTQANTDDTNLNTRSLNSLFGNMYGFQNPFLFPYPRYEGRTGRYLSFNRVRQAQVTKQRKQFETDLAMFLVNLMKSAKPTLLKAFIKATLADKQLKETAIGLFFSSSDDESEKDSDEKETDKESEKETEKETSKDKGKKDKEDQEGKSEGDGKDKTVREKREDLD